MNETPASSPAPETGAATNGRIAVRLPAVDPQITYTILGMTILVFALQFLSGMALGHDVMVELGAKDNDAIRAGQLWRFFTPMLLHGSLTHIAFNMYALFSLGRGLERQLGHGRFLLLYILAGFSGNVFSFLITKGLSVGASTSIFGLIAAEGIFLYQNRKLFGRETRQALNNIVFVILFNLFLGFSSGGLIDNWGHMGGLLGGAIFAWFAGPLWEVTGIYPNLQLSDRREFQDLALGAGTVIILFGALAAWGIISG
jgi:rhomboid protease GluP